MAKSALIFGGSGKVSRQLTKLLTSQSPPWTVYSLIRSSSQTSSLESLGATPVVQSVEDSTVSELVSTIKKYSPDVVIWAAGAGGGDPSRTETVDKLGAIKSMDATAEAGVKRYIIVSACDVRDVDKPTPAWYDESDVKLSARLRGVIGPYMSAKLAADAELCAGNSKRKLDYTIIRPGGLMEVPGKGTVAAGRVHIGTQISRADVASVVFEVMQNDGTIGLAFDVVGGDTPIKDAIQKAVDGKEDCFEGHY